MEEGIVCLSLFVKIGLERPETPRLRMLMGYIIPKAMGLGFSRAEKTLIPYQKNPIWGWDFSGFPEYGGIIVG